MKNHLSPTFPGDRTDASTSSLNAAEVVRNIERIMMEENVVRIAWMGEDGISRQFLHSGLLTRDLELVVLSSSEGRGDRKFVDIFVARTHGDGRI